MMTADRSIDFLIKSKSLADSNRVNELIIPDKQIQCTSLRAEDQILISQYATALLDEIINPLLFNASHHYSLPVIFALIYKAMKLGLFQIVDQIVSFSLREISVTVRNKHILLYNKAKILLLRSEIKASTFYCENLLISSGNGCDYYTYEFLRLLMKQGRNAEALKIAERHLQGNDGHQKHKIQSVYIFLLSRLVQKKDGRMERKVEEYFHNKKLCLRNCFNIALLLKNKHPGKSLQVFKNILAHLEGSDLLQFVTLVKINILQIYEKFFIPCYPDSITKGRLREILEECEFIYMELENYVEKNQALVLRRKNNLELLGKIIFEIKNQNNLVFFQSIRPNPKPESNQFETQLEELLSEANIPKDPHPCPDKYYQEKRAEHEKKLRFLMKKEKQLKKFFQNLHIQRNGNELNIKLVNKNLGNVDSSRNIGSFQFEQLRLCEQKYEQKMSKLRVMYGENEVNSMIANFVDDWIKPCQKQPIKIKNREELKKFVISLDCLNQQKSFIQNTCQSGKIQKQGRDSQQFRVKNRNTSRKSSEKMLEGLKHNDYISNKIIHNLKSNMAEKKKEEGKENSQKNFKQLLHEGEIQEQQGKLEQAHQHYVQMYKRFKGKGQKQTLLLKIGANFEKLGLLAEAEKTYMKCTRYDCTEAFLKLGSFQIRNGKVEMGIENLEKANCIDRHNLKIEIELVYGYSLMEGTTQRALALANAILKSNPECMEALIMSSKILQKKGKLKQALDIGLAISNSVKTASTYHYVGLLYLNDSNVCEAFRYFHKAIECDPNHQPSLIELATIISEEKPHEAIEILKNVLSSDPCNQLAFARLGKIYETYQNDYENALLIYKKGLQDSPSYENFVKIGDCHFKLGSVVDAYLNYKEALTLKITPEIYEKIADVHQFQHQDKKAAEAYAAALAQLPKDGSKGSYVKQKKYLSKLGKLLLANQQFETAYGYLVEAASMEQNLETLKLLGQACFGKGDYTDALHYYEQAAALSSGENIEILENIAMCFDKKQQYLTSKQIYEKILSLDPKNIKCLNNLANILLILGKTNEAFYWFEFMLQQAPTNIDKRMRVADIYATIGDWSKVEQHLSICFKQKENDIRVIEKMVNLYKEKRDTKQLNKFEKRLALLKSNTNKNN